MFKLFPSLMFLALIPTVFAVAYEYQPRGIDSLGTWLPACCALVMLYAAKMLGFRLVRHRVLVAVGWLTVVLGAAGFGSFLFGLAKFVGLTQRASLNAATLIVVAYIVVAFVSGRAMATRTASSIGGTR